jgi:hypothetical protein
MTGTPLYPLSFRATFQEVAQIDIARSDLSRSAYIRFRVFDEEIPPPNRRSRQPIKDYVPLSQALALLGQSHIPNNINQLARLANSGSLPFTP